MGAESFTRSCLEELQHRELNELVTNSGQALADLHCTNSTARLSLIAHVQYPTSSLRLQVAKVFAKTNCGLFPRPEYLGVPRKSNRSLNEPADPQFCTNSAVHSTSARCSTTFRARSSNFGKSAPWSHSYPASKSNSSSWQPSSAASDQSSLETLSDTFALEVTR